MRWPFCGVPGAAQRAPRRPRRSQGPRRTSKNAVNLMSFPLSDLHFGAKMRAAAFQGTPRTALKAPRRPRSSQEASLKANFQAQLRTGAPFFRARSKFWSKNVVLSAFLFKRTLIFSSFKHLQSQLLRDACGQTAILRVKKE